MPEPPPKDDWRDLIHEVIFEADTPTGKFFDVALLIAILLSVLLIMLESVPSLAAYHSIFYVWEWVFTILFSIEYLLRLICVRRPWRYALSFYGIVDLLAVLPTYLELMPFTGTSTHSLLVIRALRLLRVFRVFKLGRFLSEAKALRHAIWLSRAKIIVFLTTVLVIVVIMGSMMHLVEGPEHGFTSIPQSMYWAVVTMTTVGYGDIAPVTPLGKVLAAMIMIMGYSLIIIPTGILSAEMASAVMHKPLTTRSCTHCSLEGHDRDAQWCKHCGEKLE